MAGKAIFFELLSEPPINSFCNAFEKTGNRWRYWQFDKNDLSCHFGKPKSSESDNPIKNRWTIKSDSKFSLGVAFLTMLKFAYFRVFLITFGLPQGPLRNRTSPNMIFGMSFDGLMTSARKRNGSKKSQSLGSEIMCHPTLRFKFQIFIFLKHIKFSIYSIILMSCLPYYLSCAIKLYTHENCLL